LKSLLSSLPASLLISILLILALFSCQKDPYEIGFDLLPPSDTLHVVTTDTCTVEAFSVLQDSVRTDKVSTLILGSMMDPTFGQTTAGFYAQARLSSEGADFGTNPVLDSLVLVMFYKGYYGDTLTQQRVKVYEISEDFSYDSLHFSNQHLDTYPTVLADEVFYPRIKDSVKVYGENIAPHLRINLSKQTSYLGNKILNAPSDALATNTAFLKFMKGLYVTAAPVNNNGAMLNFSVTAGTSKLVVYFHNGNDPADDSLHYDMYFNEVSGRFIHCDHGGYLSASQDLKRQILNRDSSQGVNKLFLQGMGGVKVKLKFPYIKNLGQGKLIAINDAILQLTNIENDTVRKAPASLTMVRQDSIGRIGYLVDESEGASYFGGTYNETTHTYFFRMSQHFQNVVMNSYSDHFDIYLMVNSPVTSFASPNRITLYGTKTQIPGQLNNRLNLKITYTILN